WLLRPTSTTSGISPGRRTSGGATRSDVRTASRGGSGRPGPPRLSGPRHRQDVERRVELLLREVAPLDVPALDHDLADRLALLQRLLRDLRRVLVADVLVQRRDDRRR